MSTSESLILIFFWSKNCTKVVEENVSVKEISFSQIKEGGFIVTTFCLALRGLRGQGLILLSSRCHFRTFVSVVASEWFETPEELGVNSDIFPLRLEVVLD